MTTFVALDFETANHYRDSACAIGLVRVEDSQIGFFPAFGDTRKSEKIKK